MAESAGVQAIFAADSRGEGADQEDAGCHAVLTRWLVATRFRQRSWCATAFWHIGYFLPKEVKGSGQWLQLHVDPHVDRIPLLFEETCPNDPGKPFGEAAGDPQVVMVMVMVVVVDCEHVWKECRMDVTTPTRLHYSRARQPATSEPHGCP